MPTFKLLKLGQEPPVPYVQYGGAAGGALPDDGKPATKRDIRLLQVALQPPTFTQNADMMQALKLREQRENVLHNDKLSTFEKLNQLARYDEEFNVFKTKADEARTPAVRVIEEDDSDDFREQKGLIRTGKLTDAEILDDLTAKQAAKSLPVLQGLKRMGTLEWTDKGELYNPETNSIIPGSDITRLLWYRTVPNKKNVEKPRGYDTFTAAVDKLPRRDVQQTRKSARAATKRRGVPRESVESPSPPRARRRGKQRPWESPDEDDDEEEVAKHKFMTPRKQKFLLEKFT